MRPKTFQLSTAALGKTPWHRLDDKANPFSVSFHVDIAGNTGSYNVQHGFSTNTIREANISRTTTTATVTMKDHGLAVADSVVVRNAGAPLDGTFDVASVTDVNTFTYTVANSGATAAPTAQILTIRVMKHGSFAADKTTSFDHNYAFPCQYVRMACTTTGAGSYYFTVSQGSN